MSAYLRQYNYRQAITPPLTKNKMKVTINDYKSGKALAHNVEVDGQILTAKAQMPEGVIRAGDILSDYQISEIAAVHVQFSADTTVYCD